jgi:hypothetical protein
MIADYVPSERFSDCQVAARSDSAASQAKLNASAWLDAARQLNIVEQPVL